MLKQVSIGLPGLRLLLMAMSGSTTLQQPGSELLSMVPVTIENCAVV